MKRICLIFLALVLVLSMVACAAPGNKPTTSTPTTSTSPEATAKPSEDSSKASAQEPAKDKEAFTCIVSESAAGAPFSQLTWKGFETIKSKTGAKVQFVEALEASEREEQLRSMADLGANPVYSMFDAVNLVSADIADEYPNTHFILIDCNEKIDKPNVTNIIVDSFEPSFVAGVVAAMTTKTGKVGWVGCLDIPVITRFYDGFAAGIRYANSTFGLKVVAEKAYIGDAADTVKGAETAKLLINKGADIIYHAANEAGLGVIQACAEAKIKCIGVDKWQGDVNEVVFWSALIAIDNAVYDSYNRFADGKLESGFINYGVNTGSPIFDDRDYKKLPDNVKKAVDDVLAGIRSGKIDVASY